MNLEFFSREYIYIYIYIYEVPTHAFLKSVFTCSNLGYVEATSLGGRNSVPPPTVEYDIRGMTICQVFANSTWLSHRTEVGYCNICKTKLRDVTIHFQNYRNVAIYFHIPYISLF